LRARVAGYRSSEVRIPAAPGSSKVDVGNIVLYPEMKAKERIVHTNTIHASEQARKLLHRAQLEMQKLNLDKALENLNAALLLHPRYVEAWYRIALIHQHRQLYFKAEEAFQKVVSLDPNYSPAYLGLATMAWYRQNWIQMLDWSGRCLNQGGSSTSQGYFLNAMALYRMNMLDAAEEIAKKGLTLDIRHEYKTLHLLLAEILFSKLDTQGSIQQLRRYLQTAPKAPDAARVRSVMETREKQLLLGNR